MESRTPRHSRLSIRSPQSSRIAAGLALIASGAIALLLMASPAYAVGTTIDLGTAANYSVLGGQSVTNTGTSVLNRDVGVSPGSSITGFPPGIVNGDTHATDANASQAQSDLLVAYDDAAGQPQDGSIPDDLVGRTFTAGVYKASSSDGLTGTVTLDAQGDPDAVFIFQIGSTLITAPNSKVALVNGAQSCNVFWQVGSSATLDTNTTFVGTIMALTSVTVNNGSSVAGRALARNGSVTLDTNVFTTSACTGSTTPPGGDTGSTTPPGGDTGSTTPPGNTSTAPTAAPLDSTSGTPTGTLPGGGGTESTTTSPGAGNGPSGSSSPGVSALPATGAPGNVLMLAAGAAILAGIGIIATSVLRAQRTKS